MSVTFILGRSGSGKTAACFSAIVNALQRDPLGPPLFWLLPRQATFTAERRLTCDSGLSGYCRARVVGFSQLADDIAVECGKSAVPQVTSIGRQMILGHLLRQYAAQLKFFHGIEREAGLAAELDATFDEFERSGKTAADLRTLLDDLSQSGPIDAEGAALAGKLHDLHLLYDRYTAFLGQERLDQHRRLQQTLDAIASCSFLPQAALYVDDFTQFTDAERKTLVAIARTGACVSVTLLLDPDSPIVANPHLNPDEMSLFHRTEMTYKRLYFAFAEAGIDLTAPRRLDNPQRYASPDLSHIERELFAACRLRRPSARKAAAKASASKRARIQAQTADLFANVAPPDTPAHEPKISLPGQGNPPSTPAIELIEAPDRAAEVDAVARRIGLLLRQGSRLRDIVVLVRDLSSYHDLIAASFAEHGIPFFADRRRSAAHHPLLQLLRGTMQAAMHDWRHDAVMAMLKSGLAGLSPEQTDEIENYVLEHRVRGSAWASDQPWSWHGLRPTDETETPVGYASRTIDPAAGTGLATPRPEPSIKKVRSAYPTKSDESDAGPIDALRRRVSAALKPLVNLLGSPEPKPICDMAAAVYATFEGLGVRLTLGAWINAVAPTDSPNDDDAFAALRLEQRAEHEQVWARLEELFSEMVDVLGDIAVTPSDFHDIVESGLDGFDLGLTPPTVDEVLVGQVDRTAAPPVTTAFILGLNQGEFPALAREASVLSDRERRELQRRKLELDPSSRRRTLDERLLGYTALTVASERLILSRALGETSGRKTEPSSLWLEVTQLFPHLAATVTPAENCQGVGSASAEATAGIDAVNNPNSSDAINCIATPRQLVAGMLAWVRKRIGAIVSPAEGRIDRQVRPSSDSLSPACDERSRIVPRGESWGEGPSVKEAWNSKSLDVPPLTLPSPPGTGEREKTTRSDDAGATHQASGAHPPIDDNPRVPASDLPWLSLYHWLVTTGVQHPSIQRLVDAAWPALSYSNGASLSSAVTVALFPRPLSLTASQLETMAACPFRHFARFGLQLRQQPRGEISGADLGSVYHRILEKLIGAAIRRQDAALSITPEQIAAEADQAARQLRGQIMLSSARNRYLLDRVKWTIDQVLASQRAMLQRSRFRPLRVSAGFGPGRPLPPLRLQTPGGDDLSIAGPIDRIDATAGAFAGAGAIAVYDYRLSAAKLSLIEVYHGLALQLLASLLAADAAIAAPNGQPPELAGAFYVQLLRYFRDVDHPDDAAANDDDNAPVGPIPRGIFQDNALKSFDPDLQQGPSAVVAAKLTKDGSIGYREQGDAAARPEFAALLDHVRQRLAQLGQKIVDGDVSITPYRLGQVSPCSSCEYRGLCRFETSINKYNILPSMRRTEVLRTLAAEAGHE